MGAVDSYDILTCYALIAVQFMTRDGQEPLISKVLVKHV